MTVRVMVTVNCDYDSINRDLRMVAVNQAVVMHDCCKWPETVDPAGL